MNQRISTSLEQLGNLILSSLAILALSLATGCSQGGGKSQLPTDPNLFNGPSGPIPSGIGGGGGGGLGGDLGAGKGPAQPLPGSNNDGSLSATDKAALNAAFGENNQVAPTGAAANLQIFTPDLAKQARDILTAQRLKQDTSVKKLLFMAEMIKHCGELAVKYAPIPGQPLLGTWNGSGSCSVSFEVSGNGAGGKYAVSGGTNGTLQADTGGRGAIQANPFSGNVIDSPQSGTGLLTHPSFFVTKSGSSPCNVNVALQTPKSPIPENYKTAMRLMGKCLRNTAILINPVFDHMFQDLNPQLAKLLQDKFLNVPIN